VSAELLREAAALIRQRAEAATPGRWERDGGWSVTAPSPVGWVGPHVIVDTATRNDAEHIAGIANPAVALAVADWLDATAAEHESDSGNPRVDDFFAAFDTAPDIAALAVARAYLNPTTPVTAPSPENTEPPAGWQAIRGGSDTKECTQ